MKKKLEAELMSIAHKILQLKNKSDVEVLLQETQKLYEKLSVLKFVEENFSHLQPTIGKIEVEREMEAAFEAKDKKAQDGNKEEAFAERTQQDEHSKIEEDDPEDIAADTSSEKEDDSEKDESFEKEEAVEEIEEQEVGLESEKVTEEESQEAESEKKSEEEESDEEESESESEEEEVAEVIEQGNVNNGSEDEDEEIDSEEELDLEENSEEDSEAVVEENEDESEEDESDDDKDESENNDDELEEEKEEHELEVLESPAAEETTEEEGELEMPTAFSSEEESQVKTLEIGTAEAIANDEVLQDKPEDEKSEDSEKLFKPAFDWDFVAKEDDKLAVEEDKVAEVEKPVAPATRQFTFDDLLGSSYKDPVFVTPADLERERMQAEEKQFSDAPVAIQEEVAKEEPIVIPVPKAYETPRPLSINDKLSKGIIVGLNDRIAFVKNLFANSNEDYNRVLSQMLTFNTMEEAKQFIDEMVKPDYKNWEGKEEYEERFLEVISKKFA